MGLEEGAAGQRGHISVHRHALYGGAFMQVTAVFSLQVPVPSLSNTEMPEEKQLTTGELPALPQDAGQAEH